MAGILIVDDEEDYRLILMDVLGEAGHAVFACSDGEEALLFMEEHVPDLIISDWIMPRLNGLELLRALRSGTRLARRPFLLVSVKRTGENEREALGAGADAFLGKPFLPEDLLRRTDELLSGLKTTNPGAAGIDK